MNVRPRILGALTVIAVCATNRAASQTIPADCTNVAYYLTCALRAAAIPELRDILLRPGEREIRFWTTSGNMMPEKLLVLRQRGDSATGTLLLIWIANSMSGDFADSVCLDRWSTAVAGLCTGRLSEPQDWRRVMRQLDSAGLSQVLTSPVHEQPCDRTPVPPTAPGRLPADRLCGWVADGFTDAIEVRTGTNYWRYQFPQVPDSTAVGPRRDQGLLEILRCVSQKYLDGPCRRRGP